MWVRFPKDKNNFFKKRILLEHSQQCGEFQVHSRVTQPHIYMHSSSPKFREGFLKAPLGVRV